MKRQLHTSKQRGLTLLELLTTTAIVAIMAAVAVPSFSSLINNNQQRAELNDILRGMYIARSEAVKRGQRSVICASSDGVSCDPDSNWNSGWIVFVDQDADDTIDNGEPIIQVGEASSRGFTLIGSADVADRVRYEPTGDALESGTLTLCDSRGAASANAIVVSASGKPKKSKYGAGGAALACPSA